MGGAWVYPGAVWTLGLLKAFRGRHTLFPVLVDAPFMIEVLEKHIIDHIALGQKSEQKPHSTLHETLSA